MNEMVREGQSWRGRTILVFVIFLSFSLISLIPLLKNVLKNSPLHSQDLKRTLRPHDLDMIRNSTFDYAIAIRNSSPKISPKIKYISVIAERHSGSTWFMEVLRKAFPGVRVEPRLCTCKHWFHDRIHDSIVSGKRKCQQKECFACKYPNQAIVMNLWRNPYDWMVAFNEIPWHAVSHQSHKPNQNGYLPLVEFMKKPWKLSESDRNRVIDKGQFNKLKHQKCIDNFSPEREVDFLCSTREFIYETAHKDPVFSGDYYDGPYALREAKIRDFMAVPNWAPNFHTVQYEAILLGGYPGLVAFFDAIARMYQIKHDPKAYKKLVHSDSAASLSRTFYGSGGKTCKSKKRKACAYLSEKGALVMMQNLFNDELEAKVGYHKLNIKS